MSKIKPITPPQKDTDLVGFRHNLSLSEHRIFLHLLKSAFWHKKGLGLNKKDVLSLYINCELAKKLAVNIGTMGVASRDFANKKDSHQIYWNSDFKQLSNNIVEHTANMFTVLEYSNGYMTFQFNPHVVPLLAAVLAKFDKYGYDVTTLAKVNSKYALRLQEMLLLNRGKGQRNVFTNTQLRAIFIPGDNESYKQNINEIVRHCAEPAVKAISKVMGEPLTMSIEKDREHGNLIHFGRQSVPFHKADIFEKDVGMYFSEYFGEYYHLASPNNDQF